jgi:signal transduction histidine kinase
MATVRPDDLQRSITNRVENAVKFGTETTIRLSVLSGDMTIDVEDDGPGISDADKAAVLEPFVRGDHARNMDEAPGFGLGLSIANSIAAAHGGELSLHDRQPKGLIARIRLPLRQSRCRRRRELGRHEVKSTPGEGRACFLQSVVSVEYEADRLTPST